MRVTFLGTSAAMPTTRRNVSAIALQFDDKSDWWLFDCGEATQHQLLRAQAAPSRLERIFVSHLHGDHCFGLPGLLCSRAMQGSTAPITLHGPEPLDDFIDAVIRTTTTSFPFEVHVEAIAPTETFPRKVYADARHEVTAVAVPHVGLTLAFLIKELPLAGRFDAARARELGVPPGPAFGQLTRGEAYTTADGRVVQPDEVVGPPRPGRLIAVVSDAGDASAIAPHAAGADLLIHEATYADAEQLLARKHGHSTATDAARLAATIGARHLALTHFSPRYETRSSGDAPGLGALADEAAAHFDGPITLARDHEQLEIPRRT